MNSTLLRQLHLSAIQNDLKQAKNRLAEAEAARSTDKSTIAALQASLNAIKKGLPVSGHQPDSGFGKQHIIAKAILADLAPCVPASASSMPNITKQPKASNASLQHQSAHPTVKMA